MAVLDLNTGQKIQDAPTPTAQPSNDPLIELRGLLERQQQGEQGLDQQIESACGALAARDGLRPRRRP